MAIPDLAVSIPFTIDGEGRSNLTMTVVGETNCSADVVQYCSFVDFGIDLEGSGQDRNPMQGSPATQSVGPYSSQHSVSVWWVKDGVAYAPKSHTSRTIYSDTGVVTTITIEDGEDRDEDDVVLTITIA